MRTLFTYCLFISIGLWCFSCQMELSDSRQLIIHQVNPQYMIANMGAFQLRLSGEGFSSESKIYLNGKEQETQFLSETELSCVVGNNLLGDSNRFDSHKKDAYASTPPFTGFGIFVSDLSDAGSIIQSNTVTLSLRENHQFSQLQSIAGKTDQTGGFPMFKIDKEGGIHVVWDGGQNVYYTRSLDNGKSWEIPMNISKGQGYWPQIAVSENQQVYITFLNRGTYFCKSSDRGASFSNPVSISGEGYCSIVSGKSNFISVTFDQFVGLQKEIFNKTSYDGGQSWSEAVRISFGNGSSDNAETVIDAEGRLYTTWKGSTVEIINGLENRIQQVFFSRSTDGGQSWSAPVNLSSDTKHSSRPVIACDDNGNVYIVWFHLDWERRSYFVASSDAGTQWSNPKLVPEGLYGYDPDICCDARGNLNLCWVGEDGVYVARSTDNGASWSASVKMEGDYLPRYPEIENDRHGNIFLFMQQGDYEPNTEILFTKSLSDFASIVDEG